MKQYKNIKQNLINFLQNEVKNSGLSSVVVGLSGGLDSAVVAVLCKEAFGKNLTCILMPSQFSSKSSVEDSIELCEKFDINYEIISIEPMLSAYLSNMNNNTLRVGNFSARLRMSVLYDKSFEKNSLVVGTSNRSEILLGYSTIFGDTAYAINPIGNIYKSDLFDFAKFLGVTDKIINKKPSADFYENQSDEDDLGYSYSKIDSLLKAIYDEKQNKEELIKNGFENSFIDDISKRVEKNRFKTELAKIAKI
ncbi:NAD+ synthase [Arcobacter porcinus]|uniref:NAD+ synthase n=1 Tax=Arcobacter porcinus TaxID=1935204 RepID=UPI00081F333E|nr:NAD+ synthase [Arcobacter porcinus]OCL82767.1 NH(3)-dependent NAD(+) synthetase [Arcobacter porcinus]